MMFMMSGCFLFMRCRHVSCSVMFLVHVCSRAVSFVVVHEPVLLLPEVRVQ